MQLNNGTYNLLKMYNHLLQNIINSKKAIYVALLCFFVIFMFIWQGVETMLIGAVETKNTVVRIFVIIALFVSIFGYVAYLWVCSMREKIDVFTDYVATVTDEAEMKANEALFDKEKALVSEAESVLEELYLHKNNYEKLIKEALNKRKREDKIGEITLPFDYSFNRDKFVLTQQKGANGQTVYSYAYYELKGNKLTVGKANFDRVIDSVNFAQKIDSDICKLKIYTQAIYNIDLIPSPYKEAIQLGILQTETVLTLCKQWNCQIVDNNIQEGGADNQDTVLLL